jgi:hypothetical protein
MDIRLWKIIRDVQCAGINRLEAENERVLHEMVKYRGAYGGP